MPRILMLLPSASYRAPDFLAAAARLGADVVVGSEHRQALSGSMGDRAVVVPLADPDAAVDAVVALDRRSPLDAVLAVDDQGVVVAARASERLGLRHNPPEAVAATRDKAVMRGLLAAAEVVQPPFSVVGAAADVPAATDRLGYPCVVKPVGRSASQGVIRVDDRTGAAAAAARIERLLGDCPEPLIVERFVPGDEVAVEGLLEAAQLRVLAVFDKPDPLDGPYFEETIYVTPSRHAAATLADVERTTAAAVAALGLEEGPVHAELRIGTSGPATLLEVAARSIGGRCSRALEFGAGVSLEEVIVGHALGIGIGTHGPARQTASSGVMMLPIRSAGVLEEVSGQDEALAVEGVVGLDISVAPGRPLVPLPEGDRYLGFVFARGETPEDVERALRDAESRLHVRLR